MYLAPDSVLKPSPLLAVVMALHSDIVLDYHGQPVSAQLLDAIVADLQRDDGVNRVTAVLLHGCALTDADLARLLPHLGCARRLERLDVGDNRLTAEGMDRLAATLIAVVGSGALADSVAAAPCRLADLRVAGNQACGAQGLSRLAAALASITTLTKVDLSAMAPIELNGAELALGELTRVLEVRQVDFVVVGVCLVVVCRKLCVSSHIVIFMPVVVVYAPAPDPSVADTPGTARQPPPVPRADSAFSGRGRADVQVGVAGPDVVVFCARRAVHGRAGSAVDQQWHSDCLASGSADGRGSADVATFAA